MPRRSASALLSLSVPAWLSLAVVARGQSEEPVWPLANGSHDVQAGFQEPTRVPLGPGLPPLTFFHEGVDLRGGLNGALDDVLVMRSGVVRRVLSNPFNEYLSVVVQTSNGVETDEYRHVLLEPWQVGETIHAGDVVGRVSDYYGPEQSHLHITRLRGAGTLGFGKRNLLHPLSIFASLADRDPWLSPARPQDANRDGVVFHVAPDGQPRIRLPYAFRAVELLLEATDRQSDSLSFAQVLQSVGYWVESRAGGDDVASAARPYRLMRFDDEWRRSHPDCDTLFGIMLVNSPAYLVRGSPPSFPSLATYRLTHAAGSLGLGSDVSPLQAWHTDARMGSGEPNGTGALEAREIQEARFPDGSYLVHALTSDIRGEIDTVFDVVVDNFRPYVKSFRLLAGERELYRSAWTFDPDTSRLVLRRSELSSALHPREKFRIELEFSEPMGKVELLAITPALGLLPLLTSSQAPDARTTWSGTLWVAELPRGQELARLHVSGQDLAGTTLFPFLGDGPVTAPFDKRSDSSPIDDPTEDAVHAIPLTREPVARAPRVPLRD